MIVIMILDDQITLQPQPLDAPQQPSSLILSIKLCYNQVAIT